VLDISFLQNLLLKPATDGGFIIKIVDFGLSNTHEGGRLLQTACGSPCYAAPEMIAGKEYVGPVADMWSIGVILFALVCGYLPFEDQNTSVLYRKILSGTYSAPQWISADVKDLIRKILETDPRKRYTAKDIRQHAWYTQVRESDIPVDVARAQDVSIQNDALAALKSSGIDMQQLMDGLSSHSCNSTTAMYHMLYKKLMRKRNLSNKDALLNANAVSVGSHRPSQALPALDALSLYPAARANNANMDLEQRVRETDEPSFGKPTNKYDPANAAPVPAKFAANLVPINNGPGSGQNPNLNLVISTAGQDSKPASSPFAPQFSQQQPTLPPNTTRQQVVRDLPVKNSPLSTINPYQQPPQLIVHPHAYQGDLQGIHLPDRGESRAHSAGSATGTRSGGFRGLRVVKQPVQLLPKQSSSGSTATTSSVQSPYVPKLNLPNSGSNGNRAAYIHDLSDRIASVGHAPNIVVSQTARDSSEPADISSITPKLPLTARAPGAPAPSSAGGTGSRRPVAGNPGSNRPGYQTNSANSAISHGASPMSANLQAQVVPTERSSVPVGNTNQYDDRDTQQNATASKPATQQTQTGAPPSTSQDAAQRGGDVGPVVVSAALAEILGMNPEDMERPSTRRSHMRSRGGESRENDARPQSGMGDDGMALLGAGQGVGVAPMGRIGGSAGGPTVNAVAAAPNGVAAINPAGAVKPTGFANGTAGTNDVNTQWPSTRQPERPPVVRPPITTAAFINSVRPAETAAPTSARPTNSASGGRRGRNIMGTLPP
jgi:serine/threonine protein kinase